MKSQHLSADMLNCPQRRSPDVMLWLQSWPTPMTQTNSETDLSVETLTNIGLATIG